MNRRQRLRVAWWLHMVEGDAWVDEPLTNRLVSLARQERAADVVERRVTRPIRVAVCRRWGHTPVVDCPYPEHDFCWVCGVSTPGQAPRRGRS